jgi:hypothetical protein
MHVFYKRQYYYDLLQPLAEQPTSNIPKVGIPEHLTRLLDDSSVVQIIPVARNFLHSILYVLYPKYQTLSWSEKEQSAVDISNVVIPDDLKINLIVIDSESFTNDITSNDAPCVILYKDDLGMYYPVNINGNLLTSSSIDAEILKFM